LTDDWVVVEAVALIVLAGITAFYAWSTHRIVRETVKDRRVRRIEKALEGFYYPLLELKDLYKYPYPPDYMRKLRATGSAISAEAKLYGGRESESWRYWFDVNRRRYLAERGTIKVLDSFLEHSTFYWTQAPHEEAKGELLEVKRGLIAEVKKDIVILEERLAELHG